jgi:predicted PurR-regulated permease PerM
MTDSQKWLSLSFILVTGWLVYLLSPVLMPFAIAAMLAYLGDPLADKLEIIKIKNYQLGRTNAVIIVFLVMLIIISMLLIILIPKLEFQISQLLNNLPAYTLWLNNTLIPLIENNLGLKINLIEGDKIISLIKSHWQKAGQSALVFMGSVSHSGRVLAEWLMNLVFIPVITFYLLRDWDILIAKIHHLLPRRMTTTATKLAIETNAVLGEFIRGQFYVMIALGVIYSLGLWLIGLNLALLIGMIAGLVSFVPYLGSIVGIVIAGIAAIMQFQDLASLMPVALVFIVGQSIEGMLLTPLLVGDKIGLHPVAVMFAVLAGGQLFGFLGILLALPLASVIMVVLKHLHGIYQDSDFYSNAN